MSIHKMINLIINSRERGPEHVIPRLQLLENEQLELEESDKLKQLIHYAQFDVLKPFTNLELKTGILQPPTGYVATCHKDTLYHSGVLDRNVFMGVACCSIQRTTRFTDEQINNAMRKVNLFIRDQNPDEEEASLGNNGRIGVYEQIKSKTKYVVICVSGLNEKQYDTFYDESLRLDGQFSVEHAMVHFQKYKLLAQNNRNQLLATFIDIIGEIPKEPSVFINTTIKCEKESNLESGLLKKALNWINTNITIPGWFIIPGKNISLNTDIPEELHFFPLGEMTMEYQRKTLSSVDWDFTLDDWVAENETHYLRLAGCCKFNTPHVLIQGPLDDIQYSTALPYSEQCEGFECVPCISRGVLGEKPHVGRTLNYTWEDGTTTENRLIYSAYEEIGNITDYQRYEPVFVRVSCKDGNNYHYLKQTNLKRITGFCEDGYVSV